MKKVRLEDNHPLATRIQREFSIDQDGGEPAPPRAHRRITSYALTHLMLEHSHYKHRRFHDRVFALLPLAEDMSCLEATYSDVPETLLARVFELSKDEQALATKTIGRSLGIDIRGLNAKAVGACESRSDGSWLRGKSLSRVSMCKNCLSLKSWQIALNNHPYPPKYISVFRFPRTSFVFGTFWWDNGVDVMVHGPLVVTNSTDHSGNLEYTLHLDKEFENRLDTLRSRYREAGRRSFGVAPDTADLNDLECLDKYWVALDDNDLLQDCLRGGKDGWSEMILRLGDRDQLTRILEIATRSGDFVNSACTGQYTSLTRAHDKQASTARRKKQMDASRKPVPERISPEEWKDMNFVPILGYSRR